MPVTQLDPKSALIVIDLQKGAMGFPFIDPIADVVARTRKLLDAFRAAKKTGVLINAAGMPPGRTSMARPDFDFPADWADLIPELDTQPEDFLVTKRSWSGLSGTGLESRLKSAGVTHVVQAGVATSMGIESTAREAHALGFNVTLAIDAMTDLSNETHSNSLGRIFPQLGETGTAQEIVNLLSTREF